MFFYCGEFRTQPAVGLERHGFREVAITHVIRIHGMRNNGLFSNINGVGANRSQKIHYMWWDLLAAEDGTIFWYNSW
jgi:hypothetical protein